MACLYLALLLHRFIVPISCVICNDIMAYMFGFFFGRTPLIKVDRVQVLTEVNLMASVCLR